MLNIPLTLYIHLPWCVRKCPYCDFNSHAVRDAIPETLYINRLIADLEEQLPVIWGRSLQSIFIGGGTPSLFSAQAIEQLLSAITARVSVSPSAEITLEANPGTIDQQRFQDYRKIGINRLSLGVQSFNDKALKKLGRIHDKENALRAIDMIQQSGFDNFNIDLMHGLPEQTVAEALTDIEIALGFSPKHISWYELTIEPNTVFYKNTPVLPSEETLENIQEQGALLLQEAGYQHYEVSAYCQPGFFSRHNKNYWEFGDYLGIGAGAHSKITFLPEYKIIRHAQIKQPADFLNSQKKLTADEKILKKSDKIFEFMLNALRLIEGVPISLFEERTGLRISEIDIPLKKAQAQKLLMTYEKKLQATRQGQKFLNDLVGLFIS